MLANRRRHHTVSVTGSNPEVEAARRLNSQMTREKRSQTIVPTSAQPRRERPTSLATTVPVQSSAPPTPTGSGLTPGLCRLLSPQALPILETENNDDSKNDSKSD